MKTQQEINDQIHKLRLEADKTFKEYLTASNKTLISIESSVTKLTYSIDALLWVIEE